MINYEKCIEIETLKKLITPESLGVVGVETCVGCRHFPGGPDGGCNAPEDYTCEDRVSEWLNEPYDGWER